MDAVAMDTVAVAAALYQRKRNKDIQLVVLAELVGTGLDLDAGKRAGHQLTHTAAHIDSLPAGESVPFLLVDSVDEPCTFVEKTQCS
jgi:hypothetical protein